MRRILSESNTSIDRNCDYCDCLIKTGERYTVVDLFAEQKVGVQRVHKECYEIAEALYLFSDDDEPLGKHQFYAEVNSVCDIYGVSRHKATLYSRVQELHRVLIQQEGLP